MKGDTRFHELFILSKIKSHGQSVNGIEIDSGLSTLTRCDLSSNHGLASECVSSNLNFIILKKSLSSPSTLEKMA